MLHAVSLGSVLFFLWLLLSGHFEPLLLSLGVASVVSIVLLARRMDLIDREGHPVHLGWRAFVYWPWLMWEIIKANLDVAGAILGRRNAIAPRILQITAGQKSDLGRVIYANSITLTPGTVTIAIERHVFRVHALTTVAAEGVLSGEMNRRVIEVEGPAVKQREGG